MKIIQLHNKNIELIRKAAKNNRKAQRMLYESYAPKMLSQCRYYIKDLQNAESVMLNGFFKAFTNLKSFENKGNFEGWLRKIMVREAISFLRQQKQIEFSVETYETYNISSNNIEIEIEVAEIQNLIDKLLQGYKIVFVMYAIQGYKHNEIAELLRISEGTSKSQLHKARQMLQQKINLLNNASYGIK